MNTCIFNKFSPQQVLFSDYVDTLFEEVLARREELPSYKKSMFELQPIIQSTPKPVCEKYGTVNKAEIVAAHRSRFSRRSSDKT